MVDPVPLIEAAFNNAHLSSEAQTHITKDRPEFIQFGPITEKKAHVISTSFFSKY